MSNKLVLDLETQKDFAEAGGRSRHQHLRVSVAGVYSYAADQYLVFEEKDLHRLGELLHAADQVIGFNVRSFDYKVLAPYLNFSLAGIPTLDILEEIEKVLGHRIGLSVVATATLGQGKSGTGMEAIRLWKEGRIPELKEYCLDDVRLTRAIYEYGQANGKLLYKDFFETREIPVNFAEPLKRTNVARQASLF